MEPTKANCSKKITHKTYGKPSAPGAVMARQKLLLDPMSLELWVETKIQSIVPGTHRSQITTAVMVRGQNLYTSTRLNLHTAPNCVFGVK